MASEPKSEQEVIMRFQNLQRELSGLGQKIEDLRGDAQEHELVANTLQPMDPSRKCFRLIGSVLVERTVAEVVPAINSNKENLNKLTAQLEKQFEQKEEELAAFQKKYKIRFKDQEEGGREEAGEKQQASGSAPQGVLVSNK